MYAPDTMTGLIDQSSINMVIRDICSLVNGKAVCVKNRLDESVDYAFASDLMSDVLTLRADDFMMITGLANIQSVRTAEMSDVKVILLCRGKRADRDTIELARDSNIMIIESPYSVFRCAGVLYQAGLKPLY